MVPSSLLSNRCQFLVTVMQPYNLKTASFLANAWQDLFTTRVKSNLHTSSQGPLKLLNPVLVCEHYCCTGTVHLHLFKRSPRTEHDLFAEAI